MGSSQRSVNGGPRHAIALYPATVREGLSETILMSSSVKAVPEIELKFLVAPDDFASLEANEIFAHEVAPVQLRSVYYDTPNWDLHKRGISLRVRNNGTTFVQTVKHQAGQHLFNRDEWQSDVKDGEPDPVAWVGTPVATILGKKGSKSLHPVFSATVLRTTRLLDEGTSQVEISIDRGELAAGELREPIDELELELKGGDPAALFGAARRLGANAVLMLSFQSKAERGYRLRGQNCLAAHKGLRASISRGMPVAAAFSLIARSCLAQIADNATLLSLAKSPEVLHQLRVGLRRLRAAFATFEPILLGKDMDRLKGEAKWLSGELDPARDLDVFLQNNIPSIESDLDHQAGLDRPITFRTDGSPPSSNFHGDSCCSPIR
jgi:triphosphatase